MNQKHFKIQSKHEEYVFIMIIISVILFAWPFFYHTNISLVIANIYALRWMFIHTAQLEEWREKSVNRNIYLFQQLKFFNIHIVCYVDVDFKLKKIYTFETWKF